jgi:uncharacterized alkaline shock family protein YloU
MRGRAVVVKILDRFLLFVYSLFLFIASLTGLGIVFAWVPKAAVLTFVDNIYNDPFTAYTALTALVIVALISIRMFYISVRRTRSQAPFIAERTEIGEFRISLETIENLSLKAASRVRGVKDLRIRVNVSPPGLEIDVRTVVDGERIIPELTEEIQSAVKGQIEEITGYPVVSVSVYVANTVQATTSVRRVE